MPGVFLYASALGRQFSCEKAEWGNGAFTKAMIEGLSEKADRENTGFVDTDELALYVRRRVLGMTTQMQEPVRIKPDAAPVVLAFSESSEFITNTDAALKSFMQTGVPNWSDVLTGGGRR